MAKTIEMVYQAMFGYVEQHGTQEVLTIDGSYKVCIGSTSYSMNLINDTMQIWQSANPEMEKFRRIVSCEWYYHGAGTFSKMLLGVKFYLFFDAAIMDPLLQLYQSKTRPYEDVYTRYAREVNSKNCRRTKAS